MELVMMRRKKERKKENYFSGFSDAIFGRLIYTTHCTGAGTLLGPLGSLQLESGFNESLETTNPFENLFFPLSFHRSGKRPPLAGPFKAAAKEISVDVAVSCDRGRIS